MGTRHKFKGMPDPHNTDKHRCAKLHRKLGWCRRWPVPGKKRCRLHGGMSTGARTPEGKARALAARREGLQRWFAEMRSKKAAGLITRFPGGRKTGSAWNTFRMRQRRHLQEFQEARALDDYRSPAAPPQKRGRPSKADLVRRARFLRGPPERSAVLEWMLRRIEEAEQELKLAGD
jgi:hypothetical protein